MPFTKRCSKCHRTIEYTHRYCNDCTIEVNKKKKADTKIYDTYLRDKDSTAFYHSSEWIATREDIISFYNGLCIYSLLIDNKIVPVDIIHHVIPLKENKSLALDKSNLIPVCSSVHNYIESVYKKSAEDKALMQDKLYKLMEEYKNKYKSNK